MGNSYGVIESSAENIQISGKGYQNPLAGVAGWGETYMGATMASVLNGYEDPRISIYYSPATLADHTEEYLGVPQGVYAKDGDPNYYQSYSFINTKTIAASTPAVLLTAAEVWLLRAEASLRGINPKSESAKQCYETGVQASFDQWGAGDASLYLASKGKPTDYINHAAGPGKDMKALITTTPDLTMQPIKKSNLKNYHSKMDCLLAGRYGSMDRTTPYRISEIIQSPNQQ